MIYVYFYEKIFKNKSIHIIFILRTQQFKVIDDLYIQCLTQTLSKKLINSIRREYS